jgi:Glycosyl transferase family 2
MQVMVVVPTRNRADLARTAVASALADSDARVRVLVSDNSTDSSQAEQLRSWCEENPDETLRYVRPSPPLPMSPHWQWALERALESATTTHVMYLTDRLVMRPGIWEGLLRLAELHPADVLTYGDDTIVDYREPVTIAERPWTGEVLRVDADRLLRVLGRGIQMVAPTMLNTLVPRVVLEDIQASYGSVFASIAPDHCFSYRCLDRVGSVIHWDRVVVIQRALGRSNGFSQIRGVTNADHVDFLRELGERGINEHAPVPELLTVSNAIYNEYEYVRGEMASSKLPPLRRHYYLGANARDVNRLEDAALRARMQDVLSDHGWSSWTRLRYVLGLCISAAGYYGRRPHALVRRLVRRAPPPARFADSARALAYTLEHPSGPSSEPDHLWPILARRGAASRVDA